MSDTLVAIGQPLNQDDFQSYLLSGLDASYDAIVTSISTWLDPMSAKDLFAHLLNFELRLKHHNSTLDTTVGSINMTTRNDSSQN